MRAARWLSLLLAAAIGLGLTGFAVAANVSQALVTAPKAHAEVARRLRAMGVRGEFVREVETALARAAVAGPIVRRGQPFVGTSFGAEWVSRGRPARALVTFRGKQVHVEMLGRNGHVREASSRPVAPTVPIQFQGTRVELWSPRRGDAKAHLRVVGADGEIIQVVEKTPSSLRDWTAR